MNKKKVMDFAEEFNLSKTTVVKKIKENDIKTEKIKNTSYVISNDHINMLNDLLRESFVPDSSMSENNERESKIKSDPVKSKGLKEIIDLDEDSYSYIESLLVGYDAKQEIISKKNDEIEKLKEQLAEAQQIQSEAQEFDKLLAEKDIRIKDLTEDKQNMNKQIEMGIESLQNQQKLMISQNQKLIRLEEENQQLRESLMLTYKQEEKAVDVSEQKSAIAQEKMSNDPVKNNQSEQTEHKGFWRRLFER